MTNESTCSCGKPKYIGREVCYDCYKDMFYDYKNDAPTSTYEEDDEDDFVLKHDVAQLSPSKYEHDLLYITNAELINVYAGELTLHKSYVFNKESRVKDYEALVEFLLANMIIHDDAKGFEKVKYMFKEVDK